MTVRVRFAPSPTGNLHIGGARSALFNYLFAKHHNGHFLLRIEDTDKERSRKEYEDSILDAFQWLNIKPDEGPREGGDYGPYRQSERLPLYRKALEDLLESGQAFYCSHPASEEEYTVHWCEDRDSKKDRGILRFKAPKDRDIVFTDLVREDVAISTNTFGDFSIAKDLDTPLYNLANVVDDEAMKVTHIIRGEEHIANTPKQILLYGALGYPVPQFAHIPLLLGPDRSKLSKRDGATSVIEFRENGYLPPALVNFLALLGWNPGTEEEIFSLSELEKIFTLDRVHRAGAIFDYAKLDWMNGEYIRKMSVAELSGALIPFIDKAGVPCQSISAEKLEKIIMLEQPRLKKLSEIGERVRFYFEAPQPKKELLLWKKMDAGDVAASLGESSEVLSSLKDPFPAREEIESRLMALANSRKDRGEILWPLRAALTGLKASPGPFDVIFILGRDECLERIRKALDALKAA